MEWNCFCFCLWFLYIFEFFLLYCFGILLEDCIFLYLFFLKDDFGFWFGKFCLFFLKLYVLWYVLWFFLFLKVIILFFICLIFVDRLLIVFKMFLIVVVDCCWIVVFFGFIGVEFFICFLMDLILCSNLLKFLICLYLYWIYDCSCLFFNFVNSLEYNILLCVVVEICFFLKVIWINDCNCIL